MTYMSTRELVERALVLARRKLQKLQKEGWHEEDHPRASDGRFGTKPGHQGCTSKPTSKPPNPKGTPSKQQKTARRFRNVARRRRVIAAVKVEGELATAIGGVNLPDSEPADVVYAADSKGQ